MNRRSLLKGLGILLAVPSAVLARVDRRVEEERRWRALKPQVLAACRPRRVFNPSVISWSWYPDGQPPWEPLRPWNTHVSWQWRDQYVPPDLSQFSEPAVRGMALCVDGERPGEQWRHDVSWPWDLARSIHITERKLCQDVMEALLDAVPRERRRFFYV